MSVLSARSAVEWLVLRKKDRRQLQNVLNRYYETLRPSDKDERKLNAWARRDLWDAHRAPCDDR